MKTLLYEEDGHGVAWVTLNRPDVYNAFDDVMADELSATWQGLRTNDDIRCVVLTGAGEKAFSTGIDRASIAAAEVFDPLRWEDPGRKLGPRSNGLWKPVIAAVNGIACGGAFYMLGEVDFIISSADATYFDPHVTYGMTAVYEPLLMMRRMPWGELMRLTLLGNHERMSAQRAYEIGLVSEVVPGAELHDATAVVARAIASQPLRTLEATVRALWAARDLMPAQAVAMANEFLHVGNTREALEEGQRTFQTGERPKWRLR